MHTTSAIGDEGDEKQSASTVYFDKDIAVIT